MFFSFGTKDTSELVPVDMSSLSFDNYSAAFDATFFDTFKATVRIAVLATLLCTVIGLPVAYFLAFKVKDRWRTILLAMIIVPSFTSFLIRTLAWRIPLAGTGTLSKWLQDWGVIGSPIDVLETQTAVQIAIVYNYLGFMILPLFVALDRIEPVLREASKDLGAGRMSTFMRVTLPLAAPGIAAGVLLDLHPDVRRLRHGDGARRRRGQHDRVDDRQQFKGAQNWPLGSAIAVMMIATVLLVPGGRCRHRDARP